MYLNGYRQEVKSGIFFVVMSLGSINSFVFLCIQDSITNKEMFLLLVGWREFDCP